MYLFPESMKKLVRELSKLPSIGEKTAMRLAYHIVNNDRELADSLSKALLEAINNTCFCETCFNFSEGKTCKICEDVSRDHSLLCVVEKPMDVFAFERMGEFKGVYHVLHGAISPMLGIGPDDIKLKELMQRLQSDVSEVIIATNSSLEGETTAMYISRLIKPTGIKVSRIASGVPVGGDLEYIEIGRAHV